MHKEAPPSREAGDAGAPKAFAAACLLMLAALSGSCGDFQFVVIGDTRPTFESENFRNFERLIPRINDLKPALVINLGDLIFGYAPLRKETQWDKYEKVARAVQAPYYQLPGNHDTHSKEARKIYGRRFGKFYQSFDFEGCHFVLLDNTEDGRWGHMGAAQLEWLRADLRATQAGQVFVFLHFPVWEPERVTPRAYDLWTETLHPLFRSNRVTAVFGGHYHTYGPTREFDGIRYFITGGGGAELRPEYKKSGGEFHFMKVTVSGERFDLRVVTERGELSDTEADVMGGLQFGDRHTSRIGIKRGSQTLRDGLTCSVTVNNPYSEFLTGRAAWLYDASAFSIDPESVSLQIPSGGSQQYRFTFRGLKNTATLQSLPRLEFNVVAGGRRHRFHQEARFIDEVNCPFQRVAPAVDGALMEWGTITSLHLGDAANPRAEVRSCHDKDNLYFAITVPTVEPDEEEGFTDQLQIGLARSLGDTEFGNDFMRLGFNYGASDARNRTPGQKKAPLVPGVRCSSRKDGQRTQFEIAIPFRLLRPSKAATSNRLVFDLSFRLPDSATTGSDEPPQPPLNSFSYRVRYGADSLMPVHFVELNLGKAEVGEK